LNSTKFYRQLSSEYRTIAECEEGNDEKFELFKIAIKKLSSDYASLLKEPVEVNASTPTIIKETKKTDHKFQCPKRRFGRTNIDIPIITCGGMRQKQTWNVPDNFSQEDVEKECQKNFEAIICRAMELGINHFETARGYGCSEIQYGEAFRKLLKKWSRSDIIIQTKVRPFQTNEEFKKVLDISLSNLDLENIGYLDLFAFHGINLPKHLEWIMKPDGNLEVIKDYQEKGLIKWVGFSSHGVTPLILESIETGVFDYVNLHYHMLGSYTASGTNKTYEEKSNESGNHPCIVAATKKDMGIFIISPTDKGGLFWKPSQKLVELCKPFSPIDVNNMFLWHHKPTLHTFCVGAARATDFDEHVLSCIKYLKQLQKDDGKLLEEIFGNLRMKHPRQVLGDICGIDYVNRWWYGLPNCYESDTGINFTQIVWMWNLRKVYGMYDYVKLRMDFLNQNKLKWDYSKPLEENLTNANFDWVPGNAFDPHLSEQKIEDLLSNCPERRNIQKALKDMNTWFTDETTNFEKNPHLQTLLGFETGYNLQPDVPFPERS